MIDNTLLCVFYKCHADFVSVLIGTYYRIKQFITVFINKNYKMQYMLKKDLQLCKLQIFFELKILLKDYSLTL